MKKILSLFTMLLVTMAAMAAIDPVEVVTPDYQPAGAAFGNDKSYTIDWDKQYVKAVIDVSTCTGTSENILSVGEDLDNWFIGGWHFYYSLSHATYGANALKVDYLDTSANGKGHPLLTYKTGVTGAITIEISKEHGVLVDGEEYNSLNGTQTGTWQELTSKLWEATTIQIGSAEGSNRSNATYLSLEILPIETEEPVTVVSDTTYTDSLSTSIAAGEDEPAIYKAGDTQLLVEEMSDDTYQFTFKDFRIDGHALGDLTVTGVQFSTDEDGDFYSIEEDGKTVTFTTDDETFNGAEFTIDIFNAAPVTADNGKTYFAAYMELTGTVGETEYTLAATFGSEPKDEEPESGEVVLKEDYVADGTGFLLTTPIDWDKYKLQAIVDVTTCQRATEDILSVGTDATTWTLNIHVYRKSSGVFTSFWDGNDGYGNNNTGEYEVSNPVTIEISKADGLVVDGTVKIAANRMDSLYRLTEIAIGSGEGSNQQSYATYKSIKLVPLAVTPEPETADTVAYTGQMAYTFDMYGDKSYAGDKNATVELVKKADDTYTMVIKNMLDADGEVMGDFSFDVNVEEADETVYITATDVTAALPGEWSAYNGTVTMTGKVSAEGEMTADFTVDYGGFYTATLKFGPDTATAISDAATDRTVTEIYTIGGAKTQTLQKGVNIIRMADGKTVKVLK